MEPMVEAIVEEARIRCVARKYAARGGATSPEGGWRSGAGALGWLRYGAPPNARP